MSLVRSIVEVGRRSVRSFFEHRMAIYAEQLSYRGIFGFFPFIILVFALLAVLRVDVVLRPAHRSGDGRAVAADPRTAGARSRRG